MMISCSNPSLGKPRPPSHPMPVEVHTNLQVMLARLYNEICAHGGSVLMTYLLETDPNTLVVRSQTVDIIRFLLSLGAAVSCQDGDFRLPVVIYSKCVCVTTTK